MVEENSDEAALAKLTSWERDYISLRYGLKDGVHRSMQDVSTLLGWSLDKAKKTETLAMTKLGPGWRPPSGKKSK